MNDCERPSFSGDEYVVGSRGKISCPENYMEILSYAECKNAADALGLGWKGEYNINHRARRPYCWTGASGRANFNRNGDYGYYWVKAGNPSICKIGKYKLKISKHQKS